MNAKSKVRFQQAQARKKMRAVAQFSTIVPGAGLFVPAFVPDDAKVIKVDAGGVYLYR